MASLSIPFPDFVAGTTIVSDQVDGNNTAIVNYINARNAGSATWDAVNTAGAFTSTATSNQLVLGTTRTVTLTAPTPASTSRVWTIPDITANGTFVALEGAQTFTGIQSFPDGTNVTGNQSSDVDFNVVNSSSNAAAGSSISAQAQSGGYDPRTRYVVTGGSSFVVGVDNSDSDSFKVSVDQTELGTNNAIRISTEGEINHPLQPAFLVRASADQLNVTGDGTDYTVLFDTEVYDQNNDFASSTFTAPVTGRYLLTSCLQVSGLTSAETTITARIVTSNRNYEWQYVVGTFGYSRIPFNISTVADMDAADTATIHLIVSNGTKVVDILGNTSCSFSGCLLA